MNFTSEEFQLFTELMTYDDFDEPDRNSSDVVVSNEFYQYFFGSSLDFSKLDFKILFFITRRMNNKNSLFCTQKEIAETLDVYATKISESIKKLCNYNLCCKVKFSNGFRGYMVNPVYFRNRNAKKNPILQGVYNKLYDSNFPVKRDMIDVTKTKSYSEKCLNVRESIKRSIKFGGSAKKLRLMEYLIEGFKREKILNKTVDEIAVESNCDEKLVREFLKLLKENNYIIRKRGSIQLKTSFKEFSRIVEGSL